MKRMADKQYQHKWINNISDIWRCDKITFSFVKHHIYNDKEFICEKCKTVSDVKWPGGSCLLSNNEYMIKNIIE